jgi:hypothetical protein
VLHLSRNLNLCFLRLRRYSVVALDRNVYGTTRQSGAQNDNRYDRK